MKLTIKPYRSLPCELEIFTINGIDAYQGDFGTAKDTRLDIAPDYGCGRREFIPDRNNASDCMKKYNITIDEFNQICDELEDKLYVGTCCWCV